MGMPTLCQLFFFPLPGLTFLPSRGVFKTHQESSLDTGEADGTQHGWWGHPEYFSREAQDGAPRLSVGLQPMFFNLTISIIQ